MHWYLPRHLSSPVVATTQLPGERRQFQRHSCFPIHNGVTRHAIIQPS